MPYCFDCGALVRDDDPFCGNCGIQQKLEAQSRDVDGVDGYASTPQGDTPSPDNTPYQHSRFSETLIPNLATTQQGINADTLDENIDELPGAFELTTPPEPEIASSDSPFDVTVVSKGTSRDQPFPAEASNPVEALKEQPAREVAAAAEPVAAIVPEPVVVTSGVESVHAFESKEAAVQSNVETPAASESQAVKEESALIPSGPVRAETSKAAEAKPKDAEVMSATTLDSTIEPEPEVPSQETIPPAPNTGEIAPAVLVESAGQSGKSGSTGGRKQTNKALESGTLLNGRYEIVRRIGGGGMGAVYLAKDRHLGDAPRAVKEMIESHLDNSQHEKAIGDFKRESLLLTSLEHASIPTIYDYFYDENAGRFYLVMKYISGGDFAGRLRNAPGGRLDEKTVSIWGMEVADVLDYLHNRRPAIIYRDLKPANLMIDGNSGRVMLIDFGIARWVKKDEKGVTAVGTMGYAPPELFSGNVEPRSDVYSLGATMFHLLTGSDPQDNPLLIFDFTKNPRPRQITPTMSVEMERIVMRMVEYHPDDRFRSAGELRDVLSAHIERLRVGDVSYGMEVSPPGGPSSFHVEMVFCGFCGGRIAADDLFCAHCGAKQPLAGIGASAALQAVRSTAKLIIAGTTELDASFPLQKDSNLVGRSDPHSNIFPEVDLSKFDPETKVSRRHARIWRKGETFLVEDLGSVNGTVVLGRDNDTIRLAPHQPRVLENGDQLRLGETMLNFQVG